jgi:REP element-mobilizing transposase RayT
MSRENICSTLLNSKVMEYFYNPMRLHRNSQKRIYIDDGVYFVTTNTYLSYPYFENDILCELLVEEIMLCREMKKFKLFGYKINPEHVHILMQPDIKFNISKIMHSIKINFSRDANKLLGYGFDVEHDTADDECIPGGGSTGCRRLAHAFINPIAAVALICPNIMGKSTNPYPNSNGKNHILIITSDHARISTTIYSISKTNG